MDSYENQLDQMEIKAKEYQRQIQQDPTVPVGQIVDKVEEIEEVVELDQDIWTLQKELNETQNILSGYEMLPAVGF